MGRWTKISRCAGLALALCCLLVPVAACAHPHVFIEASYTLHFGDHGLQAVGVTWRFDDVYTDALMPDYLKKGERQLSPEAVKRLEADIFRRLDSDDFYTDIAVDGRVVKLTKASGFTASLDEHTLVFDFQLPLDRPLAAGKLDLFGFDPEYYIEFTLADRRPRILGSPYVVHCSLKRFPRDTDVTGPIDVIGHSCLIGSS